jgi:hypothetical protein
MLPTVLGQAGSDFRKAAAYIESHVSDPDAETIDGFTNLEMVTLSLFHEFIRLNLDNKNYIEEGIALCRNLSSKSRLACIEGMSGGHMKYGEPEKEYEKWLGFCGSSLMTPAEKDVCYKYVASRIRIWYRDDVAKSICTKVESDYRKYCEHISHEN